MKTDLRKKPILRYSGARILCALLVCCMLACGLLLPGCGHGQTPETPSGEEAAEERSGIRPGTGPADSAEPEVPADAADTRAVEILAGMTLEEKVSQLFVLTPEQLTGYSQVTQAGEATREALEAFPAGGLLYMQGNLVEAEQTRTMLANTQEYSMELTGLPLLTMIDEEGGSVRRISGHFSDVPQIGSMADLGSRGSTDEAYTVGRTISTYLSDLGFNCDCAPVADVLTNPENTVVADRAFGSDPYLVSEMAAALARGLEGGGVIAVWKHFPGHGSTAADSHTGYAYSNRSLAELEACDLIPFRDAVEDGCRMIMAAHISLPNVTGDEIPASLNGQILTGILREQLGYRGVIITDALNMGAVTDRYDSGEAAVLALQAGADMLLMPEDPQAARQAVLNAVAAGTIAEARIDESVLRIITLKLEMN